MEHLQASWPLLEGRVAGAAHVLLAFDYDGTLAPIAGSPDAACLPQDTRALLDRLSGCPRCAIAVLSGRAVRDVRNHVGLENIIYGGNHGLEIAGPGITFIEPLAQTLRPLIAGLSSVLRRELEKVPGVLIEDKGLTLSVHYRNVEPNRVQDVLSRCEGVLAPPLARRRITIRPGKMVWEVRPALGWGKGEALSFIRERVSGRRGGPLPFVVYVGDDETDEDAFEAANACGGVSVFVGEPDRRSKATHFVRSPEEVRGLLEMLSRVLSRTAAQ